MIASYSIINNMVCAKAGEIPILIQCLALLDKRVGKRRLKKINPDKLHPLACKLFNVRVSSDG